MARSASTKPAKEPKKPRGRKTSAGSTSEAASAKPASSTTYSNIDGNALRQGITEVNDHKEIASKSNGDAGKATAEVVKNLGIDKTAFTSTARLANMVEPKRDATICGMLDNWLALGWLDTAMSDWVRRQALSEAINRFHNAPEAANANTASADPPATAH